MSSTALTPVEIVQLNAGYNPITWVAGDTITSSTLDTRPPAGRIWSVDWSAVFVTGNTIALTLDRSTGATGVSVSELTQAFSASSTATLEALRDQIRALAGVLWCTSEGGSSAPSLTIAFDEGRYGQVTGGTVTGGASQPTATLTENTPGASMDGGLVAAVGIHLTQALATVTDGDDMTYTARRRYEGTDGNSITVEKVEAGTNTPLSISVSGLAITVNLATDGGGTATTTGTQLLAAMQNDPEVMNLISVSSSSPSTVQTALATLNLASGTDRTYAYRIWGFLHERWTWEILSGGVATGQTDSLVFKINVGHLARLYCEITAVSGAGASVTTRIAVLGGGS